MRINNTSTKQELKKKREENEKFVSNGHAIPIPTAKTHNGVISFKLLINTNINVK